jgi:hypothetical protein
MRKFLKSLYAAIVTYLPSLPKRQAPLPTTAFHRCLAVHMHYAMHTGALDRNR